MEYKDHGAYREYTRPDYAVLIYIATDEIIDPLTAWVDTEIRLKSGERYFPSFFTLKKIQDIMQKDKVTQDDWSLNGSFFWAVDQIIVERVSVEVILTTLDFLYREDKLQYMFSHPHVEAQAVLQALPLLSDAVLRAIAAEEMSDDMKARLNALMESKRVGTLNKDENYDLDQLFKFGNDLRRRKAEATRILTQRSQNGTQKDLSDEDYLP